MAQHPAQPLPRWVRWRWWLLVTMAASGVVAGLWVMASLRGLETRAIASAFRVDATELDQHVRHQLADNAHALGAVAEFRAASEEVTAEEFSTFVAPLLARLEGLQAISWNEVLPAADREAHEAAMRRAGHPEYRITERARQHLMVPAAKRAEYVVVRMIEPLEGNECALGFDVASEPKRREALTRARQTRTLALTAPIVLVQEVGDQRGFLGILPSFQTAGPSAETPGIEGYYVGVFRAGALFDAALEPHAAEGIHVRVEDTTSAGDPVLLHDWSSGSGRSNDAGETALRHVSTTSLGGREWRAVYAASPKYVAARRTPGPLVALLAGLVITTVVTAYVALLQRSFLARERAKRELERGAERLRITMDAVADGAWDWNVATGEVLFSDSWLAGLGYDREDVEPHVSSWERIVHPDDYPRVMATLEAHFENQTDVYECENRLLTKSGEYRWNVDRGRVVQRDADGRPLRMVGTDTDITDRKAAEQRRLDLEERVRHAQKLESLGVLAGGIAHDFNNLLVGILGAADVALRRMPDDAPGRRQVERIKIAGSRASELTQQMLAYAGGGRLNVERLDLGFLVAEMAELLNASISKKADLLCASGDEQAWVNGDATQLRQVVMNLITNASDALGGGAGAIRVRTGVLVAGEELLRTLRFGEQRAPGSYAFVEVSDTGVGMSKDVRERMFDPFFTTKVHGRGLGLAAVMGIVNSHAGAIGITSKPGRGTSIRVLLPLAAHAVPSIAPADPSPSQWRRDGVALVVDDEEAVREVAQDLLESCGFDVLTAADGRAGVELFRERGADIDVVLLDMAMPHMDGAEAFREIRKMRPDARVVFSSGVDDLSTIPNVGDDRRVGFISKPYLAEDFIEQIRGTVEA